MTLTNDLLAALVFLSVVRTGVYLYEAWRRYQANRPVKLPPWKA